VRRSTRRRFETYRKQTRTLTFGDEARDETMRIIRALRAEQAQREAAAAEALVIGIGRHHHEAARPDQRVEIGQGQAVGGGKEGVGAHGERVSGLRRTIGQPG